MKEFVRSVCEASHIHPDMDELPDIVAAAAEAEYQHIGEVR